MRSLPPRTAHAYRWSCASRHLDHSSEVRDDRVLFDLDGALTDPLDGIARDGELVATGADRIVATVAELRALLLG